MISMTDFTQIIQLRSKGKTQQEIAEILNIGRRSVIRYLKNGQIPQYVRVTKSSRVNPLDDYHEVIKQKLKGNLKLQLNELYEYLCQKGYTGSERTLRRRTRDLRTLLKNKEVYFQREVKAGEIMEGDFTEFYITIGKSKRKIYLWVTSLPYSNCFFATPFYHCSFEAFAEGSMKSFCEFGGVAEKYRLDNLSPVVSKILSRKERIVTTRYAEFQEHYGFKQDFCNPGKGNEKGNVEANNKYIKNKINARISLNNLSFSSLEAFKIFVWDICREHNLKADRREKFLQEPLNSLPQKPFKCFRTSVVSINKFSLFSLEKTGHMYSVPSQYIGLSLECRIYSTKIEIIFNGEISATHSRLYGPRGHVSIYPEHIISGLLKKPGAMKDWKYRNVLFERPAWVSFYNKLIAQGGRDKDYLKCLKLITQHGKDLVTIAMELSLNGGEATDAGTLSKIITNDMENIHNLKPLDLDLIQYNEIVNNNNKSSNENIADNDVTKNKITTGEN